MPIFSVGLSHQTTPVEIRETVAVDEATLPAFLQQLQISASLEEVAVLSTCNRLEIYAVGSEVKTGARKIQQCLAARAGLDEQNLDPYLYTRTGTQVADHLLSVACGLDSMILGEPQILGQVGDALAVASATGTTGQILHRLLTTAVRAGKRARAETAISRHTTSTSHAAVLLAKSHVPHLEQSHVLVVGAGEMAQLAIKALHQRGALHIGCINRTFERASALVHPFGGQAFNWYHLGEALVWADVVIAATGAPHTVIHCEEVAEMLPQRQGRPLVFVDVALPRDVEENVEHLSGVYRYDIDDLRARLDENLAQREAARPSVESIVQAELTEFIQWHNSRQAVPTLVQMRRKAQSIAADELTAALAQLPDLDEHESAVVQRLVHRLVNKILHDPTVQLKSAAAHSPELGEAYAHVTRRLFNLDPVACEDESVPALDTAPTAEPEVSLVFTQSRMAVPV